jgi:hypothetical protein
MAAKEYQYLREVFDAADPDGTQSQLNMLGQEGWLLVAANQVGNEITCYLVRELQKQNTPAEA